jgi:hypothetical protein
MGHHLDHPGHLLGLAGVYGHDVGMGNIGLHQGQTQGIGRQLEPQIGAVVQGAGNLGHGRWTRVFAAPDLSVGGQLIGQLLSRQLAPHHLGRIHHRIHHLAIPGTTAGIAMHLEPVPDLLAGGVGIFRQQGLARHNEPGGAESTLGPPVHHPGKLERVKIVRAPHPFDGRDRGPVRDLGHLGDAGPDQLVIQNDIAATALPFAAPDLGAGQAKLLAQDIGQGLIGSGNDGFCDAVDLECLL